MSHPLRPTPMPMPLWLATLAVLAGLLQAPAQAQPLPPRNGFPAQPIRFISPFSAT